MTTPTILVVEDDDNLREAICTFIEINELNCVSAANGTDAMSILKSQRVDLTVCDINLPDILGTDILKQVRQDPVLYKLPFIFLSAFADKTDVSKGMNLGADDYITKPFSQKVLIETIMARLQKAKQDNIHFNREINSKVLAAINSNLSHEIITPLNGIINGAYFINTLPNEITVAEMKDTFVSIYSASLRMKRDIQNIITSSTLLSDDQTEIKDDEFTTGIDVNNELHKIVNMYNDFTRSSIINTQIEEVNKWTGSAKYLRIIFTELIDNALKFSTELSPINLFLNKTVSGFSFTVTNAVNQDFKLNIDEVEPYKKFHQDDSNNGLGLGLFVAKSLCPFFNLKLTSELNGNKYSFVVQTL